MSKQPYRISLIDGVASVDVMRGLAGPCLDIALAIDVAAALILAAILCPRLAGRPMVRTFYQLLRATSYEQDGGGGNGTSETYGDALRCQLLARGYDVSPLAEPNS